MSSLDWKDGAHGCKLANTKSYCLTVEYDTDDRLWRWWISGGGRSATGTAPLEYSAKVEAELFLERWMKRNRS